MEHEIIKAYYKAFMYLVCEYFFGVCEAHDLM